MSAYAYQKLSSSVLAKLERMHTAGVRFGTVLTDAGYGTSTGFRHGLDARGLGWAVGIPRNQTVYEVLLQSADRPKLE